MSYALITGGSSGIGFCYAQLLAAKKFDIIIVSNQEELNQEACKRLESQFSVHIQYVTIDLASPEAAQQLFDYCQNHAWNVEVLINNAGMFFFNTLTKSTINQSNKMIQLHITTPSLLCALFGNEMKKEHHGYILNTSSLCAWTPYPTIVVYSSTKRYLKEFSRALAFELNMFGVRVCAVCPGAVDTDLYNLPVATRKKLCRWGIMQSPEQIARKGVKALFKEKKLVIPGAINYLFLFFIKIAPNFVIDIIKKKFDILKS